MRKLTLDAESLKVESFDTGDHALRAGTVHARNAGDEAPPSVETIDCCDSVGCTWFPTCTCTLEGACCASVLVCPPPPPKETVVTAVDDGANRVAG